MLAESKNKTLAAIGRLEGLTKKLRAMVEDDAYCGSVLEIALAMQGQLRHIQGTVLESHLHTCAAKRLKSARDKNAFIEELVTVIGLSKRA